MSLDNLDWRNGRLAVSGKGRRQEWLPLPQDVGAAILANRARCREVAGPGCAATWAESILQLPTQAKATYTANLRE